MADRIYTPSAGRITVLPAGRSQSMLVRSISTRRPTASSPARRASPTADKVALAVTSISTRSAISIFMPATELWQGSGTVRRARRSRRPAMSTSSPAETLHSISTGTGEARIAVTFGTNSNITVTAVGNITLATAADADGTTTGGTAFMGSFGDGAVPLGGNVAVTSTGGAIALNAGEDQSLAAIGNQSGTPATSGNLTVSAANGTITLDASGNAAQAIIGNLSQGFGAASGDITIVSGNALDITATNTNAVAQIGNGGPGLSGAASGDIKLTIGGNFEMSAPGTGATAQLGNGDPTNPSAGPLSGNIVLDAGGTVTAADPNVAIVARFIFGIFFRQRDAHRRQQRRQSRRLQYAWRKFRFRHKRVDRHWCTQHGQRQSGPHLDGTVAGNRCRADRRRRGPELRRCHRQQRVRNHHGEFPAEQLGRLDVAQREQCGRKPQSLLGGGLHAERQRNPDRHRCRECGRRQSRADDRTGQQSHRLRTADRRERRPRLRRNPASECGRYHYGSDPDRQRHRRCDLAGGECDCRTGCILRVRTFPHGHAGADGQWRGQCRQRQSHPPDPGCSEHAGGRCGSQWRRRRSGVGQHDFRQRRGRHHRELSSGIIVRHCDAQCEQPDRQSPGLRHRQWQFLAERWRRT